MPVYVVTPSLHCRRQGQIKGILTTEKKVCMSTGVSVHNWFSLPQIW